MRYVSPKRGSKMCQSENCHIFENTINFFVKYCPGIQKNDATKDGDRDSGDDLT